MIERADIDAAARNITALVWMFPDDESRIAVLGEVFSNLVKHLGDNPVDVAGKLVVAHHKRLERER